MDLNPLDLILHLDSYLTVLISSYGTWIYAILFTVVFCETGLVVMPFLPGDSLLFIAGAMSANGSLDPFVLAGLLMVAAIAGDSLNYQIGRRSGNKLFNTSSSRLFRRENLQRTQDFYARHGGKTVTLARFLPILRTFAPFVAGIGKMHYPRFLGFSIAGTLLWVGSMISLGFFFGNVPFIKHNLTFMIVAVILLSLLPMIVGVIRHQFSAPRAADPAN